MKILASSCGGLSPCCPHVADPADDSGELIVTGKATNGDEVSVRIRSDLLRQALIWRCLACGWQCWWGWKSDDQCPRCGTVKKQST